MVIRGAFRFRALTYPLVGALLVAPRSASPQGSTSGWQFTSTPGAAAWFSLLRDLRLSSDSPMPLYRPGSSGRTLPDAVVRLRNQSMADVLHFGPLYAPDASPVELRRMLRAASDDSTQGPFLTQALRAVMPSSLRRSALPALADALEAAPVVERDRLAALQVEWERAFAPALQPYLERERLSGGRVLVDRSLGPEGRVFTGRPDDPTDNVVAVADAPTGAPIDPILALLRELCFPRVTRLTADLAPSDRRTGEQRAARLAVRCGAVLADRVSPEIGAQYRALWLRHFASTQSFGVVFRGDSLAWSRIEHTLQSDFSSPR